MRKLCLFFFSLFGIAASAQQSTVLSLQPDTCGKDALISSYSPNNNYGGHWDFLASAWTVNNNPSTTRALIEFDLSPVPANANIIGATLRLYHHTSINNNTGHSTLSGPNDGWIERITQPWTEYGVTWNNQPSTTTQNRVAVPASTSTTQNYLIDVTALVQDMMNDPSNSHGFLLRLQNESYYRSLLFASSDEAQQGLHPKLTITFSGQLASEPDACQHADTIITTTAGEYSYELPNVFTPNNDGINDSFNVLVNDTALRQLDLEIFDRWGRRVYKGPAPWDGNSPGGNPCTDGMYYYYAMGRFFEDSYAPRKGCFQLLR